VVEVHCAPAVILIRDGERALLKIPAPAPDKQKVTCHGRPKSREGGSPGVGTRPKRFPPLGRTLERRTPTVHAPAPLDQQIDRPLSSCFPIPFTLERRKTMDEQSPHETQPKVRRAKSGGAEEPQPSVTLAESTDQAEQENVSENAGETGEEVSPEPGDRQGRSPSGKCAPVAVPGDTARAGRVDTLLRTGGGTKLSCGRRSADMPLSRQCAAMAEGSGTEQCRGLAANELLGLALLCGRFLTPRRPVDQPAPDQSVEPAGQRLCCPASIRRLATSDARYKCPGHWRTYGPRNRSPKARRSR
jgi:hypothetical protein